MSRFAAAAEQLSLEEILAEAREGFLAWSAGAVADAKKAAPGLATDAFAEAWEVVFGVLHDCKGGGGSVGLDLVTAIADNGCRYLKGQKAADAKVAAAAAAHLSAVEGVLRSGIVGDGGAAGQRLLEKLRSMTAA